MDNFIYNAFGLALLISFWCLLYFLEDPFRKLISDIKKKLRKK